MPIPFIYNIEIKQLYIYIMGYMPIMYHIRYMYLYCFLYTNNSSMDLFLFFYQHLVEFHM